MTESYGSYVIRSSKDKDVGDEFVYGSSDEDEIRHPKKALDSDDDVVDPSGNVPPAPPRVDAKGRVQLQLYQQYIDRVDFRQSVMSYAI